MSIDVHASLERWPLKAPFTIARRTFYESLIATVRVCDEAGNEGVGECEPHDWDEAKALEAMHAVGLAPDAWAARLGHGALRSARACSAALANAQRG